MHSEDEVEIDPRIGSRVGAYEIVDSIGRGAMGAVYLARHAQSHGQVAIKILHAGRADHAVFRRRFRREASAARRIAHDSIIKVFELGVTPDGLPYFVMEWARGTTLAALIRESGRLSPVHAAKIARELALGLAAAHASGFVHRDLKPANVMVDGDAVKILDFGIVGLLRYESETQVTEDGILIGTPTYMAPEQVLSPCVGPAADLYALGVIMYEMLSGRPPFLGAIQEVAAKHVAVRHEPLEGCDGLEAIVDWLLEKRPRSRPKSAEALAHEIDRWLESRQRPSQARRVHRRQSVVRAVSRQATPRRVGSLIAASAVVGLCLSHFLPLPGGARSEAALAGPRIAMSREDTSPFAASRAGILWSTVITTSTVGLDMSKVASEVDAPQRTRARKRGEDFRDVRERLDQVSRALAQDGPRLPPDRLSEIEERYLGLSASLSPGLEASAYRSMMREARDLERRLHPGRPR
jgi:serine/threonine protein kinase